MLIEPWRSGARLEFGHRPGPHCGRFSRATGPITINRSTELHWFGSTWLNCFRFVGRRCVWGARRTRAGREMTEMRFQNQTQSPPTQIVKSLSRRSDRKASLWRLSKDSPVSAALQRLIRKKLLICPKRIRHLAMWKFGSSMSCGEATLFRVKSQQAARWKAGVMK